MRNYRIIKVTYENNEEKFYVQRECRFLRKYLFFGPKVWRTYNDDYLTPARISTHEVWHFSYKLCDGFEQLGSAERIVKDLRLRQGESNQPSRARAKVEVIE